MSRLTGKRGDGRGINGCYIPIFPRARSRIPGCKWQWYQAPVIPDVETYRKTLSLSEGHIDARECFHAWIVARCRCDRIKVDARG